MFPTQLNRFTCLNDVSIFLTFVFCLLKLIVSKHKHTHKHKHEHETAFKTLKKVLRSKHFKNVFR